MNRLPFASGRTTWWLAVAVLISAGPARGQEAGHPGGGVVDEPAAHAVYDEMIRALRQARSLSFESIYEWKYGRKLLSASRYRLWLKKPNYFRMENYAGSQVSGVLVGDGRNLWIYWPSGQPPITWNRTVPADQANKVYLTKPAPPGAHSILHEAAFIGAQTILEASIFHGYTDSLQPYLDGVRSAGTETIDGQDCRVIELSFLNGQRLWKLWIARSDRLPRRIEETVRVATVIFRQERWTGIALNEEISNERFRWRRPMGWARREWPDPASSLLRSGRKAPDFELLCADGKKRRLSQSGEVVWLVFWRFG